MSASPIEGVWGMPKAFPGSLYHFIAQGSAESLCGKWRLREMSEETECRPSGHKDCNKCAAILQELAATMPGAPADAPAWTVKTDDLGDGAHVLSYQGKEQSRVHGPAGLTTQKELAALFNKNGTVPKKKKTRCAADAPNPAKFLEKKTKQSPELPLETPSPSSPAMNLSEAPALLHYLENLWDSEAQLLERPPIFEAWEETQPADPSAEELIPALKWLFATSEADRRAMLEHLAWTQEIPGAKKTERPEQSWKELFGKQAKAKAVAATYDLFKFIADYQPAPPPNEELPPTTVMPAKTKAVTPSPVDHLSPVVETFPASHYRRYPTNRTPDPESVKNMAASIRENGVLQPIIARVTPGDTEIEILAGETRWLGCKLIDPDYPLPCFLRNVGDKEAAKIHAVENFQRKDLNPFEEGREVKHMLDCGWTMGEIAAHLGKSESWLYKRMSILNLPEEGKTAFMDGNLTLNTVMRILSLPEEKQLEAVKAVSEPTHASSALSERDALELIHDEFVKPMEKAAEWEERRALLEKENPGCIWLKYEHAIKAGDHQSEYVRADYRPARELWSDAAKMDELVVPTWKDLALKHGAPIYIGLYRYQPKEAFLYVSPDAIVEAEKAAHDEKPEECIFSHEKAVQKTRDDAARRKLEEEQRKEAEKARQEMLAQERQKLVAMVLAPDGLTKAATKKLVEMTSEEILESGGDLAELAEAFGLDLDGFDWKEAASKLEAAKLKFLRSKSFTPFEALGRLRLANWMADEYSFVTVVMFESGAAKPAEFPTFHEDYLKRLAFIAEEEKKAAALAAAEEANQEEAA